MRRLIILRLLISVAIILLAVGIVITATGRIPAFLRNAHSRSSSTAAVNPPGNPAGIAGGLLTSTPPTTASTLSESSLMSTVASHLVPHIPQSTPEPDTCGPWSSPDSPVGSVLSQKYGEMRNCLLFDNAWIILTEGLKLPDGTRESGVAAVYRCQLSDPICLNGQEDHPLDGWQIYTPPCPGELSLGADSLPGKLQIMGTCANYFDVATGLFTNN